MRFKIIVIIKLMMIEEARGKKKVKLPRFTRISPGNFPIKGIFGDNKINDPNTTRNIPVTIIIFPKELISIDPTSAVFIFTPNYIMVRFNRNSSVTLINPKSRVLEFYDIKI